MYLSRGTSLLVALTAHAAFAGGIGYLQATGYYKQDSRPTLYQPLNLLDGREGTAWCSPNNDPLNELITVGFNGTVKLEEIKVTTGNRFDAQTFTEFARAKKFTITSGKQSQSFTIDDKAETQTLTFDPPMTGARFQIEVLDQYPGEDLDAPVCVTDLIFVADGRPANGQWLTTKLKYDRNIAGVLGTWFQGFEKTPDKFLSFNFDGTFRFSFEPFESARFKEKVIEGTYDITGSKLSLEIDGKRVNAKYVREGDVKKGFTLSLDGDLPAELKGAFRSTK